MVTGGVIVAAIKITPNLLDRETGSLKHEFGFMAPEKAECKRAGRTPGLAGRQQFFVDEEGLLQLGSPVYGAYAPF